jgi:hypothetical protein
MTRGDDAAQSPGPTEPKWGQPIPPPLCQRVKEGRCMGHPMPKVGAARKLGGLATVAGRPA